LLLLLLVARHVRLWQLLRRWPQLLLLLLLLQGSLLQHLQGWYCLSLLLTQP
jgi:hypothetical protein